MHFRTGTEAPILNQLNFKNRPKQDLTQMIPVGRLEHQKMTVYLTIGMTVGIALLAIVLMIEKAKNSTIRVWKENKTKTK